MSDTLTLYHNPRCSKSRAALQLLQQAGADPELRLYMEQPLDRAELAALLAKLGIGARELLRSSEPAYREFGLADDSLSEDALIDAMLREPKLMQRPIAELGNRALIGRPPEQVLELLE